MPLEDKKPLHVTVAERSVLHQPPLSSIQSEGLHFESARLVTRGFAGDVSQWSLPDSEQVIEASGDRGERCARGCAIVAE